MNGLNPKKSSPEKRIFAEIRTQIILFFSFMVRMCCQTRWLVAQEVQLVNYARRQRMRIF